MADIYLFFYLHYLANSYHKTIIAIFVETQPLSADGTVAEDPRIVIQI